MFTEVINILFYKGKNKKLGTSLWIRTEILNKKLRLPDDQSMAFEIPKSFMMDLASIPKFMWWFISPLDWIIMVPSIAHDWIYREKRLNIYVYNKDTQEIRKEYFIYTFTRKEADLILKEKMQSFGGGIIKRSLVYLAVRLFGGLAWKY